MNMKLTTIVAVGLAALALASSAQADDLKVGVRGAAHGERFVGELTLETGANGFHARFPRDATAMLVAPPVELPTWFARHEARSA